MKVRKYLRKWVKDEKRIVKLAYRKGLLTHLDVNQLYWDGFKPTPRKYKSEGLLKWWRPYYPEIYYIVTDYWGEADDVGVVDTIFEQVYWGGVDTEDYNGAGDYPPSNNQKYMSRPGLIKYLESLPTIVNDSKINEVLYRDYA